MINLNIYIYIYILKIAHAVIGAMIKIGDFDVDYILIDEKSYGNVLVYNISYEHLIAAYDGTRCSVLYKSEK